MDFQKLLSQSDKKPQTILKAVLGFSVALMVIWLFLVSRMELGNTTTTQDPEIQQRTEGLKKSLMARDAARDSAEALPIASTDSLTGTVASEAGQNTTALQKSSETVEEAESEAPNMMNNAFTTFAVMVVVMGGIWLWARRKSDSPGKKIKADRNLDSCQLNQTSELKFVKVNQEVWVLGVTPGNMELLQRIPQEEWKEQDLPVMEESGADDGQEIPIQRNADFNSFYKFFKN